MLGEQIGESQGTVTNRRVLPGDDYRFVKMEVSIEESGRIFGDDCMVVGTYVAFERVPGQLYGEGQGIIQTSEGEGAIWNAHGVGQMTGDAAAMSFRYSMAVQASPDGALGRLNNVLIVGEHEVDAENNTTSKIWEWK